jgi:hypothetical protein
VYVDDILISAADETNLVSYVKVLRDAATASGYALNEEKSDVAVTMIEAFNLQISNNSLQITSGRMQEFQKAARSTDRSRETAIVGYVATVNQQQATVLKAFYGI